MKRNGMILAQCQRTKRGLVEIFVGDNTKNLHQSSLPMQHRSIWTHWQQIFLLFFEWHMYIEAQNASTLLFLVVFFGVENSWNFATAYHPPTMVPPPAGALDGTPSYRDRLPTVGRLVWKTQALYKEVMGFFGWQLKQPSNQVLLTQLWLFQSKISREPTGACFDASLWM